jgi:hypothetical protein
LHAAEVVEPDRDLGVLGLVDGLFDRERTLLGHPRRLQLAELLLHAAEVGERTRDRGRLGRRLRDRAARRVRPHGRGDRAPQSIDASADARDVTIRASDR